MHHWSRVGRAGMGGRYPAFRPGYGSFGFPLVGLMLGGVIFFMVTASFATNFFPFFFFFWFLIPLFFVPVLAVAARGLNGLSSGQSLQSRQINSEEDKETELLEVLARRREVTAARAALETSLSVSEADRMLSGLANDGHIEVCARDGRLGYALWDQDLEELPEKP